MVRNRILIVLSLAAFASPFLAGATAEQTASYQWEGASPVDAFVCGPVVGCQGYIVEDTDWIDDMPYGSDITAVDLVLEWEPVDDTVGPMVFRMNKLDENGFVENLAEVRGAEGPVRLVLDGLSFADGEFARLTVWPEEKVHGPVPVYVDLYEQPFTVSGAVTLAS